MFYGVLLASNWDSPTFFWILWDSYRIFKGFHRILMGLATPKGTEEVEDRSHPSVASFPGKKRSFKLTSTDWLALVGWCIRATLEVGKRWNGIEKTIYWNSANSGGFSFNSFFHFFAWFFSQSFSADRCRRFVLTSKNVFQSWALSSGYLSRHAASDIKTYQKNLYGKYWKKHIASSYCYYWSEFHHGKSWMKGPKFVCCKCWIVATYVWYIWPFSISKFQHILSTFQQPQSSCLGEVGTVGIDGFFFNGLPELGIPRYQWNIRIFPVLFVFFHSHQFDKYLP